MLWLHLLHWHLLCLHRLRAGLECAGVCGGERRRRLSERGRRGLESPHPRSLGLRRECVRREHLLLLLLLQELRVEGIVCIRSRDRRRKSCASSTECLLLLLLERVHSCSRHCQRTTGSRRSLSKYRQTCTPEIGRSVKRRWECRSRSGRCHRQIHIRIRTSKGRRR